MQYIDYALWQRAQFGDLEDPDSAIGGQLAYWEQALADADRVVLPTDRPYPVVADHRGATVVVDWRPNCSRPCTRWLSRAVPPVFMVMQAALAVLLAKIGATSDVAVGFPIAGRNDPALRDLVGFFVNTWCCGWIWMEIPRWPRCSPESVSAAWPHSSIRTCRSRCSSERLNPARSLTHHPRCRSACLAEQPTRFPMRRSVICTSPR